MVATIEDDFFCRTDEDGRCPKATPRGKLETGIMVAGIAVASSCQVVLPCFGLLFAVVGTVITIAAYRGQEDDENAGEYEDRVRLTGNLRVLGPICLAIGVFMLALGAILCVVSRRAKQRKRAFHCPIHGDFYPISPSLSKSDTKRSSVGWCARMDSEDKLDELPLPQCPHSNRSSLSTASQVHAPSPLPSIAPSQSSSMMLLPTALLASAPHLATIKDAPNGSIGTRSLSVSYDVASFPHTRSPSPELVESEAETETPSKPSTT